MLGSVIHNQSQSKLKTKDLVPVSSRKSTGFLIGTNYQCLLFYMALRLSHLCWTRLSSCHNEQFHSQIGSMHLMSIGVQVHFRLQVKLIYTIHHLKCWNKNASSMYYSSQCLAHPAVLHLYTSPAGISELELPSFPFLVLIESRSIHEDPCGIVGNEWFSTLQPLSHR